MTEDSVFADLLARLAAEHQGVLRERNSLRSQVRALQTTPKLVEEEAENEPLVDTSTVRPVGRHYGQCFPESCQTQEQPELSTAELTCPRSTRAQKAVNENQIEVQVDTSPDDEASQRDFDSTTANSCHAVSNSSRKPITRSLSSLSSKSPSRQLSASEGQDDGHQNQERDRAEQKAKGYKRSATFSGTLSGTAGEPDLELWPIWNSEEMFPNVGFPSLTMSTTSMSLMLKMGKGTARGGDTLRDDSCLQMFVMGPNSKWRLLWDMISVVSVAYDVLTVPLVAFGSLESSPFKNMSLITTIFWSIDIPFTFMTGFHFGGVVEMRPRMIAKHYFQRWFLLDFFIILTDWALLIAQSSFADIIGLVRISKTLRLWRLLRLIRLLRIVKLPSLSEDISENLQSESLLTILGVLRSMAIIAVVNHFIACGWYGIGQITQPTWLEDVESRDFGYRYTTAFHWSLTQFTPASMEVYPRNTVERVYAIVVLFSALVTFSTFISSITSAMTTLRRINLERSKEREAIRRYISEKRVSVELGNRITAFLRRHNFMAKRRVHEEDIQVFKVLPETLRLQLHWEVHMPTLLPHPFFHHLSEVDEVSLLDICHHAMAEQYLGTSQELFASGKECHKMFFTMQGVLEYSVGNSRDSQPVELSDDMPSRWLCEPCLWVKWEHRGSLTGVTPCELVSLQARKFQTIMSSRTEVLGACQVYAAKFRDKMLERGMAKVTDIWCDFDEAQELAQQAFEHVESMNESPQRCAGSGKLQRPWRSWSPSIFKVHDQMKSWRNMTRRSNSA